MIGGLSLEYAYARTAARLAQRPDERLWQRTRSARSMPALLETVRASPAAAMVSGITPDDADLLELAFRQQLRLHIAEVAGWAPAEWRSALQFCTLLLDLPALLDLLGTDAPPRWIAADPQLSAYATATTAARRAAIAAGPMARIAAILDDAVPDTGSRQHRSAPLHPALVAWEREWRTTWPDECTDALEALVALVKRHLANFATLAPGATATARAELAAQVLALLHQHPAQPAALFAGILLHALDLETMRGEFVRRARMGDGGSP